MIPKSTIWIDKMGYECSIFELETDHLRNITRWLLKNYDIGSEAILRTLTNRVEILLYLTTVLPHFHTELADRQEGFVYSYMFE